MGFLDGGPLEKIERVDDTPDGTRTIRDIWSNLMSKAASVGLARFVGILRGGDALMFGKFASISVGIEFNCRHLGSTGM